VDSKWSLRAILRPRFSIHPTQVTVLGYVALITIGAILLALPISSTGEPLSIVDAFFTSTSAVCVTGLSVFDISTGLSDFGKVVLLSLIQLGGLGIMVVSGLVALAIFRRLSTGGAELISSEFRAQSSDSSMKSTILRIIRMVLFFEAIGALILAVWFGWVHNYDAPKALWMGVFHAVSSFNNAGFALYPDNLMGFVADPVVSLTICALIIIGGLGFPVIMELRRIGWAPRRWTMNFNLVMFMTAVLLVGGTIYIAAFEWSNPATLGSLDPASKVLAAFFQSVQTRTAGFNSVDIGAMNPETWLGMDALMFIGGGPAGTAGGIKVTTFAVLAFIVWTELKGDSAVNIFGKRLSRSVHRQAITIALLAVAYVAFSTILMQMTTNESTDRIIFEVISAFGTVGLSTGITANLSDPALINLMLLMIVGRLGPLTLSTALILSHRPKLYEFPKERPILG
jgi:potassium uptake TrkH family protein